MSFYSPRKFMRKHPILNEKFINMVLANFRGNNYVLYLAGRFPSSDYDKSYLIEEDLDETKEELNLMLSDEEDYVKSVINSNFEKYSKRYKFNTCEYDKEIKEFEPQPNIKDIIIKLYENNRINDILFESIMDHLGISNWNEYIDGHVNVEYTDIINQPCTPSDGLYKHEKLHLSRYMKLIGMTKSRIEIIENILNERNKRKKNTQR